MDKAYKFLKTHSALISNILLGCAAFSSIITLERADYNLFLFIFVAYSMFCKSEEEKALPAPEGAEEPQHRPIPREAEADRQRVAGDREGASPQARSRRSRRRGRAAGQRAAGQKAAGRRAGRRIVVTIKFNNCGKNSSERAVQNCSGVL